MKDNVKNSMKDNIKDNLPTIEGLIQELKAMGYQKQQIKGIMMEACHKKDLTKLSLDEQAEVKKTLIYYLEFGKKCWRELD